MSYDDFDDTFEDDDAFEEDAFEEDDFEDDADFDTGSENDGTKPKVGGQKVNDSNDDKKSENDSDGDDFEDDDGFEDDDDFEDEEEDDFEDDESTGNKSPPASKKSMKSSSSGKPPPSKSNAPSNGSKIVNKIRTVSAVSKAFKARSMKRSSNNSRKLITKLRTVSKVSSTFKAQRTKRALHTKTLQNNLRSGRNSSKTAAGEPGKVKDSKNASAQKVPVTCDAAKTEAALASSPSSRFKARRLSGKNTKSKASYKTKRKRKKKENWDPSSEVEQEARRIALAARKSAPPASHVLARFGDWEMHRISDKHDEEGKQTRAHYKPDAQPQQSEPKYIFFNPRLNQKQKTTPANWPADAIGCGAPSRHGLS